MVGRFTHYKRFDLGVQACTNLKRRLIVIGKGDEAAKLRAMAGETVTFLGALTDEEVKQYYRKAKAFLFPGEEDFGITPVEAQSAGCPVIAYGRGGVTETVLDGQTGLFFGEQTTESLEACILRFEQTGIAYPRARIRQHSLQFSEERFREEMLAYCEKTLDENRQLPH